MNIVTMIGNLVKDPEFGLTSSGISVCRFSIAVNRNYIGSNGERETDFFSVVAWRGLADNCSKYLSKGKKVAIMGTLQIKNYEDSNGNKRMAVEIVADNVEFLSPKEVVENKAESKLGLEPVNNDDLPF